MRKLGVRNVNLTLLPSDVEALDRMTGQKRQRSAAIRALIRDADRKQREAEREETKAET